jgi:hypothetical protein
MGSLKIFLILFLEIHAYGQTYLFESNFLAIVDIICLVFIDCMANLYENYAGRTCTPGPLRAIRSLSCHAKLRISISAHGSK